VSVCTTLTIIFPVINEKAFQSVVQLKKKRKVVKKGRKKAQNIFSKRYFPDVSSVQILRVEYTHALEYTTRDALISLLNFLKRGKSISSFVEEKRGRVLRSRLSSEVASFFPPAFGKYLSLSAFID